MARLGGWRRHKVSTIDTEALFAAYNDDKNPVSQKAATQAIGDHVCETHDHDLIFTLCCKHVPGWSNCTKEMIASIKLLSGGLHVNSTHEVEMKGEEMKDVIIDDSSVLEPPLVVLFTVLKIHSSYMEGSLDCSTMMDVAWWTPMTATSAHSIKSPTTGGGTQKKGASSRTIPPSPLSPSRIMPVGDSIQPGEDGVVGRGYEPTLLGSSVTGMPTDAAQGSPPRVSGSPPSVSGSPTWQLHEYERKTTAPGVDPITAGDPISGRELRRGVTKMDPIMVPIRLGQAMIVPTDVSSTTISRHDQTVVSEV